MLPTELKFTFLMIFLNRELNQFCGWRDLNGQTKNVLLYEIG